MGNCKDCKWWGATKAEDMPHINPTSWKQYYRHVVTDNGSRICLLTQYLDYMCDDDTPTQLVHTGTLAHSAGSDDSLIYLMTAPNFGCVQFEPKEEGE